MKKLKPHHAAWLEAHPHRTEGWLRERTRDGFDVHHLDGNPGNNDPANLVLIEHVDHLGLHNGGKYTLGRLRPFSAGRPRLGATNTISGRMRKASRKYLERQQEIIEAMRD